jgi:concanavalin A-like lectin/glucanase superfamily protein
MSLDSILADIESILEVVVELDSAKKSDGTLKTWYFSCFGRSTSSTDTPASVEMPPYFNLNENKSLTLNQGLFADLFLSQSVQAPGKLTILQPLASSSTDQISDLENYTFRMYPVRIKIELASEPLYSNFILYRTYFNNVEPVLSLTPVGYKADFDLGAIESKAESEMLEVRRFVGTPTCLRFLTSTGVATITRIAAYDTTQFTIIARFKMSSAPGTIRYIINKGEHYLIRVNTNGKLLFYSSANVGGSLTADISFQTSAVYTDGEFHYVVFSRSNSLVAYAMVDGTVLSTFTPVGATYIDLVNTTLGLSAGGDDIDICDVAVFNYFIPPENAIPFAAVRLNGTETGLVGLWRLDDNTGGTANDYSTNNNDAVISGIVNTDYQWTFTDLGDPQLAGRPYPLTIGQVFNAKAICSDTNRAHFRLNDGPTEQTGVYETTLTVKSKGKVLTAGGTDYTKPAIDTDSIVVMSGATSEPVTFDLISDGTDPEYFYPALVAQLLLSARTSIVGTDNRRLDILCPWPCGVQYLEETTAAKALNDILGLSGLCYYDNSAGEVVFDFVLPPMGYGPYGEPCLDLKGYLDSGVTFGDIADATGSLTICGWVKSALFDQTTFDFGAAAFATTYLISKGTNYDLFLQNCGPNAGTIVFTTASGNIVRSPFGVMQPNTWMFIAAVFDSTGDTSKLYAASKGGTLVEIASAANTGGQVTNTTPLKFGTTGFSWVALNHFSVWSVAKTLSQLQALMTTPPVGNEANLLAYIPFNEGTGSPLEKVSNTLGTVANGAQWAPKLTINLNDTPSITLDHSRNSSPVGQLSLRYFHNLNVLNFADIVTGTPPSADDKQALMNEWKEVPADVEQVAYVGPNSNKSLAYNQTPIYKSIPKLTVNSPLADYESAYKLNKSLLSRRSTDRKIIDVNLPSGLVVSRQALGLNLLDEVGVIAPFPSSLRNGNSYRVIAISPRPLDLSASLVLWGGDPTPPMMIGGDSGDVVGDDFGGIVGGD